MIFGKLLILKGENGKRYVKFNGRYYELELQSKMKLKDKKVYYILELEYDEECELEQNTKPANTTEFAMFFDHLCNQCYIEDMNPIDAE